MASFQLEILRVLKRIPIITRSGERLYAIHLSIKNSKFSESCTWILLSNSLTNAGQSGKESNSIRKEPQKPLLIAGADPSATFYGCLELADRASETDKLPETIRLTASPEIVLREAY